MHAVLIGVCLQWVDLAPEIDRLTGQVRTDERTCGLSPADEAALEWAVRIGEAWGGDVLAVTHGSAAADGALRIALAAGACHAARIEATGSDGDSSHGAAGVATALAGALRGCSVVLCGDAGITGGSGAVPASIARRLDAASAFGVVELAIGERGTLQALRRLDGGRREVLRLAVTASASAVVSVEGAAARLRRAPLQGLLAAGNATIAVRRAAAGSAAGEAEPTLVRRRPARPRPRARPAPNGDDALARVGQLLGFDGASESARRGTPEVLAPDAAAARILDALAVWGVMPRRDDTRP